MRSGQTRLFFFFQPTEGDPCLYKITEYSPAGENSRESNPGNVIGLMTTHVDDFLIAGNANVVDLVGRVLDIRFD